MRYTTIIDITQCQELYRNKNIRILYLHLVLRSGYHDHDRDLLRCSLRTLAAETGLTIAAVRNALRMLEKWQLVKRQGEMLNVRKWVPEQTISKRQPSARQQQAAALKASREMDQERREREAEIERIRRETLAAEGKTQYDIYLDDLEKRANAGDIQAREFLNRHKR
ncbi:MAG: hypothetical protein IJF82_21380 [Achromobacter sp.]|nr:hypothetical protein [Achromobacter sp.]MBQ6691664.1 hypothetical protein [Rikenellaceae bacterium]